MLTQELEYFKKVQDELKGHNPRGGFAVIKEQTLLGVWADRQDAIKSAVKEWGDKSIFLVKNINEGFEPVINYSRNIKFVNGLLNV